MATPLESEPSPCETLCDALVYPFDGEAHNGGDGLRVSRANLYTEVRVVNRHAVQLAILTRSSKKSSPRISFTEEAGPEPNFSGVCDWACSVSDNDKDLISAFAGPG